MILLLTVVGRGSAWWEVGHMLVARIAEHTLQLQNQSAYQAANQLLQALNNFTDGRSNTFVESAVWADDVKESGFHGWDSFHFLDRVYDPDGVVVVMHQHEKDINSVNMVGWCRAVLRANRNSASFERALMARMLLHVVGDIHQPLHSVSFYNRSLPNGDMGGNLLNITTINNEAMNLHAFLDSIAAIIQHPDEDRLPRPLDSSGVRYVEALAEKIITDYPKAAFGQSAAEEDAAVWANESYYRAAEDIYPYVRGSSRASYNWTLRVYELCRQRIALAGYRLAHTLAAVL